MRTRVIHACLPAMVGALLAAPAAPAATLSVDERTIMLVARGARRSGNDHLRGEWVRRIVGRLDRRGVRVLFAQL